jgi:hypothetical protein
MEFERMIGNKRPFGSGPSASGTSRKNKLQRCSNCGGLGHKSRTCDQAQSKQGLNSSLLEMGRLAWAVPEAGQPVPWPIEPQAQDPRTVLAAYGLLSLATTSHSQANTQQRPAVPATLAVRVMDANARASSPQRTCESVTMPRWQPLSPSRLVMT